MTISFTALTEILIFIQVDVDRYAGHSRAYYSPDWQKLDFFMVKSTKKKKIRCDKEQVERPDCFDGNG